MSPELLPLEDARAAVLAAVCRPDDRDRIAPVEALGRVLAENVVAGVDLPPWDNSAMDGYAVIAADTAGASEERPAALQVVGEVAAGGMPDRPVTAGAAIRIATGAPLPRGATAVVPVEDTTPLAADGTSGPRGRDAAGPLPAHVLVHVAAPDGANIRARGSDIVAGTVLLRAGAAIGPAEVALAAAANAATIPVRRRPRVAVLSTGDELRPAGGDLGAARIPGQQRALVDRPGAGRRRGGTAPGDRARPVRAARDAPEARHRLGRRRDRQRRRVRRAV